MSLKRGLSLPPLSKALMGFLWRLDAQSYAKLCKVMQSYAKLCNSPFVFGEWAFRRIGREPYMLNL